ncbi:hypothetical protein EV646_11364 [Kribbella antiqua]|uniref:Uncharacterized protein n=1 Tax=Kribbella antiqua TaxID=2512217 RepID=A0A4R2IE46_9ACTN|nr:hypothetical protein [Kribbella antiqua]TCO42442.1 hypothetical protein EV646_11364 [Kribbella antiqua]
MRSGDAARIWSRQRKDLTAQFPDIAAAAVDQLPDGVVLDSSRFRVYDMAGEPMRVQRVAPLGAGEESWTVLGDDWRQLVPVEQFLSP